MLVCFAFLEVNLKRKPEEKHQLCLYNLSMHCLKYFYGSSLLRVNIYGFLFRFVEDNSLKEWSFKKAITIQTYSTYHPIPVPLNLISQFFLLTKWLCLLCARQCCERQLEKKVSNFVHDENCVTWFMFWNSKNTRKTNFPSCQIGSKVKLNKNHQSLSSTCTQQ